MHILNDTELEPLKEMIREQCRAIINDPRIRDKHQAWIDVETMLNQFVLEIEDEFNDKPRN